MFASMKKKVMFGVSLLAVLFVMYVVIVAPVSAGGQQPPGGPSDTKIDVGIYGDINGEGNPINADPDDTTEFHFDVQWAVTMTGESSGRVTTVSSQYVGRFDSLQGNTASFPLTFGPAYKITHPGQCIGILIGHTCIGFWSEDVVEEGFYHISHYNIPEGYCPQYPYGQSRKKEGTTTANMKFFKGSVCGDLYPGWDGLFGTCTATWRRCSIRIV